MIRLKQSEIPEHLLKYFKPVHKSFILRNDVIWAKRNGMPESVTDRFSKKHEFIFFFVKQKKYYFDIDSIREKHTEESIKRLNRGISENHKYSDNNKGITSQRLNSKITSEKREFEKGKNPGDVSDFWDVTIKGTREKHYAAYNDELIKKPILAGCPEDGIILDPFCGTGKTLEVAYNMNRNFIGFEGSPEYFKNTKEKVKELKNNLFEGVNNE